MTGDQEQRVEALREARRFIAIRYDEGHAEGMRVLRMLDAALAPADAVSSPDTDRLCPKCRTFVVACPQCDDDPDTDRPCAHEKTALTSGGQRRCVSCGLYLYSARSSSVPSREEPDPRDEKIARLERLIARYRRPLVDDGVNPRERLEVMKVRMADAEARVEALEAALRGMLLHTPATADSWGTPYGSPAWEAHREAHERARALSGSVSPGQETTG